MRCHALQLSPLAAVLLVCGVVTMMIATIHLAPFGGSGLPSHFMVGGPLPSDKSNSSRDTSPQFAEVVQGNATQFVGACVRLSDQSYEATRGSVISVPAHADATCKDVSCNLRYLLPDVHGSGCTPADGFASNDPPRSYVQWGKVLHDSTANRSCTAFVTMLFHSDSVTSTVRYAGMALVGAHRLRTATPGYDRVMLIESGAWVQLGDFNLLIQRALQSVFSMIVELPSTDNRRYLVKPHYLKFYAWALTQYAKVVWLGSDVISVKSVHALAECTPPCSVYDTHLWAMPSTTGPVANGDVWVFQPDRAVFDALMQMAEMASVNVNNYDSPLTRDPQPPFDFWYGPADQGILNRFYLGTLTFLPPVYHLELGGMNIDGILPGVRLVHFAAVHKPWWCASKHVFVVRLLWCGQMVPPAHDHFVGLFPLLINATIWSRDCC